MNHCPNCQSGNLKIDEVPPWNAPFSQLRNITFQAKCLECTQRAECKKTFNNLDEYLEFIANLD